MIKCLIVDDETAAIDILTHHIGKVAFLSLVQSTNSAIEGVRVINENKIDLVFLDIRMPDMSGIDFINAIQGRCKVILTTAFTEYAIKGYELDVIDYLLKPIPFPRFVQAAQKALNVISTNALNSKDAYVEDDHIYVKTEFKGKLLKIEFSDISYIESERNYAAIHRGKDKILVLVSLRELEDILPKSSFMRVHRSYIISLSRIKGIEANSIVLKDVGQAIPFGDVYRTEFLERIKGRLI